MAFDGKAFGEEMAQVVRQYVADEMGPVYERLHALDGRGEGPAGLQQRGLKPRVRVPAGRTHFPALGGVYETEDGATYRLVER